MKTAFKLLMPTGVTLSQTIAACNLAMRFGAETLGLAYRSRPRQIPVWGQSSGFLGQVSQA